MWSFAEWPVAPVDEGGVHSGRFCPDAIEGVVGHEEDLVHADTCDCGGLGIRGHVRLEGVCCRDRDHLVERNAVIFLAASSISGSPLERTTSL